jgi:hypothetical protein
MQKRRGLLRHRLGYGAQIIMVSAANPRLAKGQKCYHAKKLRRIVRLPKRTKGLSASRTAGDPPEGTKPQAASDGSTRSSRLLDERVGQAPHLGSDLSFEPFAARETSSSISSASSARELPMVPSGLTRTALGVPSTS